MKEYYIPNEDPFAATARVARSDMEFLDILAREYALRCGEVDLFDELEIVRRIFREKVLERLDELAARGAN